VSGDEKRLDGTLDERVVEFVYGELSATDEAALRKELGQRPELQAQVDELLALRRNLDTIETPEPPAEVLADIMAYAAGRNRVVRTEPVPEKRLTLADIFGWLTQPQVGMAMAAMLVVAVGVYMGQSARRPTEPGSAQEVKEQMRPTRALSKKDEAPATAAKAEPTTPASGKLAAADETEQSKVGEPLELRQQRTAERAPAATPATEEAAAAVTRRAPQQEAVEPVQEEATASGEDKNKELELVPSQGSQEGKRVLAAAEKSRGIASTVEEPEQVALGGVKADQNLAATATGSGGRGGLDEGQRKKGGDKVAVRSLVDSLQRRRDDSGVTATNDRWDDHGAAKDGNTDLDNQVFKAGDSANLGVAQGAPADTTVELDDSTHKQVNIPRKERRKKVVEKKVAGKKNGVGTGLAKERAVNNMKTPALKAEMEEAPTEGIALGGDGSRGEKREWVGNTYNRAVEDQAGGSFAHAEPATLKEDAKKEDAKSQVTEPGFYKEAAASDGPAKPQEVAPSRPAARTSVDAAWGVVPSTVPSGSLVKPVSVNPEAGSEYTVVVEKGEAKLDFGDDASKDYRGLNQAAESAPQVPVAVAAEAPMEPVIADDAELAELNSDEDSGGEEGELAAPMADQEEPVDLASKKVAVAEEMVELQAKKEEANEAIAMAADEKKAEKKKAETSDELKQSEHATKCDERWAQLLAFEQAGEHGKALKLMKMFRSGPCEGTRSQSAMDMREAQIYIASGKRSKARKVLKRLQKVPAMEQKAMDMMESIEGDGYTQ
jgi:hypothetical protein